jgi:hypothetical protein
VFTLKARCPEMRRGLSLWSTGAAGPKALALRLRPSARNCAVRPLVGLEIRIGAKLEPFGNGPHFEVHHQKKKCAL